MKTKNYLILFFMLLLTASISASSPKKSNPIKVGKHYQGGIIFYIDNEYRWIYIVSEEDLPGFYTFDEAFNACRNYNGGGYTDWDLKSEDTYMNLLKNEKYVGNLRGIYWTGSRSENYKNDFEAVSICFTYKRTYHGSMISKYQLRPIRSVKF